MSNKKTKDQNFDDFDDFDFESEFSFDEDGGFNADTQADGKRSAIVRFTGGFVKGVKENLFTRATVNNLVEKSLPHSYSIALDGALDTADSIRDTVDTAYSSVEKNVNELRDRNRDQFNSLADGLPKPIGDKIKNWANTSKASYSGKIDHDAMQIGNDLDTVFSAAAAGATAQQSESINKLMETSATQSKLMTGSNDLLSSINTSLAKLTQYQDTVGISFQRKMLETSLHQLFVQRKHLERVNQHYDFIEKSIPTIIQNTGLPDFVKIQQSEMVRQEMANRFVGQLSDNIYSNIAGIRGRIFRKMQSSIKEASQQISGNGGMLVGALADTINPGFGGGRSDIATVMGQFLAGNVSSRAAKFVGEQVKSMISESPELRDKIGDGDHLIQMMRSRLPGYMGDKLLSGNTGNGFIDGITDIFGLRELKQSRKEKIQNSIFGHLNDPAVFTLRTQRAITEVIPGLLSRIHMEVHKSNGGDPKSPLQYDWDKGGFTTAQEYTQRLVDKRIATSSRAEEIVEMDNKLLKEIDPKYELSGATRAKIAEYVMLAGVKGEDISLSYFIDPGSKLYIKELANHVKSKYNFELESGDSNDIKKVFAKMAKGDKEVTILEKNITEHRNISAQRFDDPLRELLDVANKMDISELAKYDFIKVGKNGDYSIDYKKYLNHQRSHAANIAGRKIQRAPFIDNNPYRSPFDVANTFDHRFRYAGSVAPNGSAKIRAGGTPSYWRNVSDRVMVDYLDSEVPVTPIVAPATAEANAEIASMVGTPPPRQQPSFKHSKWTRAKDMVRNNYGKLMFGGLGLGLPTISEAMTTAGDMALNGVTIGDGGTLAVVMGGAAGATYLATKIGEKIRQSRAIETGSMSVDANEVPTQEDTGAKHRASRRRSNRLDRTRNDIVANIDGRVFAKTEKLLDFILKRNSAGFDQLHEDFGLLIASIKEATISGAVPGGGRFEFISGLWDGTKKFGSSAWEKGGKLLKWKFGLYKKLFEKTKWLREKTVSSVSKAWGYLKDKKENIKGFLGGGLSKGWEGLKWTVKSPWELSKHLLGDKENPGITRRGFNKLKKLGGETLDMFGTWRDGIYLAGENFPRLDAIGLRTGKYRDEATGKIIRKLSDITGNVIDEAGVVILSKDQIMQGLYDRHGNKIDSIATRLKGFYDSTIGFGKSTLGFLLTMPFRVAGWMVGKAKGLKERLDKFKQDKDLDGLLKFGAFTNSGKQLEELIRIRELIEKRYSTDSVFGDNDGDGDRDGSLKDILSNRAKTKQGEEDEKKKRTGDDTDGKKKDDSGGSGLLGKFGSILSNFTGALAPALSKILMGVAGAAIPAIIGSIALPSVANFFRGDPSKQATGPNDPRLDPNSEQYDPNVKEATAVQKFAGGVSDTVSELPWYAKLAAGYGAYRATKWGIKKAGGLLLRGAGGLANASVASGKVIATKALPVMVAKSVALGKGTLSIGASIMASPLAPVAGAVIAAAAVGYIGYRLWKNSKKNDSPMLRIRMASYGYDVQDEDHVPKLLEVEHTMQKHLRKTNKGIYTIDKTLTRELLYPLFNVNPEDPEQKATWEKYFYYRFLPVFITFVNTLTKFKDVPIDVTKMDDNLSFEQMLTVCNDSMISKKNLNPYDVMESGFSGERKVDLDQEEVFDIYSSVKKSLDKNIRRGKVNKRQKQRIAENHKLDKEIKKEDKKLSELLTRHGYNADAILKNPVSRLFGENVVTKVLDKVTNSITSPIRAVGRMGEFVANKIGLSDSLAGTPAVSKGGVGGFFSGLLDSFLGRGGRPTPQQYPTGGVAGAGVGGDMSGKPGIAPKNTIDFAKSFTKGLRIGNLTETQTAALAANTAQTESQFRQDIVNEYGYTGLYQFGGQALADIGFMKNIGAKSTSGWNNAMKNPSNWNNGLTLEKFKASREIQDKAYVALANKNIQYGMGAAKGDKAKFQSAINDYRQLAKFLKMAHLKGAGNAVKGLLYGKDARDGNGTSMISYGNGAARNVDSILAALGGANATVSGTNTTQATTSASVSSSVNKSAAASNPVGVGVLKPDANISYKDAKIDKMKQATSGDTKIMNDIGVPLPQTKEDNAKSPISGDSQPARAARIARSRAGKKSQHRCSMYVRIALQKAGYPLRHPPSAYQNHTDNRLKEAGFVQIHVGTRWQIGDVLVVNRTKNSVHGHIQIWDGSNWISDFIQNKIVKYRDGDGFALYRDKNYLNGAIPYNGGWQPYALITGSNGSTSLPASGSTGAALGPVGMSGSGKKFTKREIASTDIIHGRVKAQAQIHQADKAKDKEPTSVKDASLGKDDKGKKHAERIAKDTAVTVNKKAEAIKTSDSVKTSPVERKPDVKTIHPEPKVPVPTSERDIEVSKTPAGVKPAVEAARQQRKQEEEARQQTARNEHMLSIMAEDKSIFEKQLSVQRDMLNELRKISHTIKSLQIVSPVPANPQGVDKPIEPTRPSAPDTIIEPVSMLKS